MVKYFNDMGDPKASWRAVQIWQILVGCAANWQIITYGKLADILGYKGAGVFGQILDRIMVYCSENDLPPLTSLIVRSDKGEPGIGLEIPPKYHTMDAARIAVFKENWNILVPPTAEEFQQVWEASRKP